MKSLLDCLHSDVILQQDLLDLWFLSFLWFFTIAIIIPLIFLLIFKFVLEAKPNSDLWPPNAFAHQCLDKSGIVVQINVKIIESKLTHLGID